MLKAACTICALQNERVHRVLQQLAVIHDALGLHGLRHPCGKEKVCHVLHDCGEHGQGSILVHEVTLDVLEVREVRQPLGFRPVG